MMPLDIAIVNLTVLFMNGVFGCLFVDIVDHRTNPKT